MDDLKDDEHVDEGEHQHTKDHLVLDGRVQVAVVKGHGQRRRRVGRDAEPKRNVDAVLGVVHPEHGRLLE